MNCRNCNTVINYNYLTNCPQCGCAVQEGELPKLDPSTRSHKKHRAWLYYLENLTYVLVTSGMGMISGAVVFYVSAALVFIALSSAETYPGENCAKGAALGFLSVLIGGFLGTVGGAVFSIKHPLPISNEESK